MPKWGRCLKKGVLPWVWISFRLSLSVYSRCCIPVCSVMVGVPHRPLLPSLLTPLDQGHGTQLKRASHQIHQSHISDLPWQRPLKSVQLICTGGWLFLSLEGNELVGSWGLVDPSRYRCYFRIRSQRKVSLRGTGPPERRCASLFASNPATGPHDLTGITFQFKTSVRWSLLHDFFYCF